jgi:hypothetical protein
MSSLYLGEIGTKESKVEIHAFTSGLPFREYKMTEISDDHLFREMLEGRYKLFEEGRSIFCTAVKPDSQKRMEENPHDSRQGCVHIVSLNAEGRIASAVSVAVDIGEKEAGQVVGLPLENRWRKQGYPEGQNLDAFRKCYPSLNWNRQEGLKPWEMAELYRHFKSTDAPDNITCRLGLYTGLYHLLIREADNKRITATRLWVFDAIPAYFNLYRFAGCAALRDLTIAAESQWLSPGPGDLKKGVDKKGNKAFFYKKKLVSRNVLVPIAKWEDNELIFTHKHVPFLDGVVDFHKLEKMVTKHPYLFFIRGLNGFSAADRIKLFFGLNVIGRRRFLEGGNGNRHLKKYLNNFACRYLKASHWEFNEIGS